MRRTNAKSLYEALRPTAAGAANVGSKRSAAVAGRQERLEMQIVLIRSRLMMDYTGKRDVEMAMSDHIGHTRTSPHPAGQISFKSYLATNLQSIKSKGNILFIFILLCCDGTCAEFPFKYSNPMLQSGNVLFSGRPTPVRVERVIAVIAQLFA
jgi:hypothetical protein